MDYEKRIADLEATVKAQSHLLAHLAARLIIEGHARSGAFIAMQDASELANKMAQASTTRPEAEKLMALDEYVRNLLGSKEKS